MRDSFTRAFSANSAERLADKMNEWEHEFVEECNDNGVYYSIVYTFCDPVLYEEKLVFSSYMSIVVSDNEDGE